MDISNIKEVIQFALEKEKEAVAFYIYCSEIVKREEMKKAFMEMSEEENRHVQMLNNLKSERINEIPIGEVVNLKISDYLVEKEFHSEMDYQDLLILAMKREEKANALYGELSRQSHDASTKKVLELLAQEELKHKLRLEKEYNDVFLKDN